MIHQSRAMPPVLNDLESHMKNTKCKPKQSIECLQLDCNYFLLFCYFGKIPFIIVVNWYKSKITNNS